MLRQVLKVPLKKLSADSTPCPGSVFKGSQVVYSKAVPPPEPGMETLLAMDGVPFLLLTPDSQAC